MARGSIATPIDPGALVLPRLVSIAALWGGTALALGSDRVHPVVWIAVLLAAGTTGTGFVLALGSTIMLGAIVGDVIGSCFEGFGIKTKDFPIFIPHSTFTDDSVLTVAVADWILSGRDLIDLFHEYFEAYPTRGYGGRFHTWASTRDRRPYDSFGNGAAMRVSPIGFAFETLDEVLEWAARSAMVTHNHPEGVRGAQATAAAIFYARQRRDKAWIRTQLESQFGYDLGRSLETIRPTYLFDVTCQGSVPEALIAFFESTDYLDAIRNAISLGGDSDTQACIAGGVAEAYYGGVPTDLAQHVMGLLDIRLASVVEEFRHRFGLGRSVAPPTRP